MNRLLLIASMLLLTASFVMAKSSNTAGSQTSSTALTAAKQETIQGCLSSRNGGYTLTDTLGNVWQLEGNTNQLKNNDTGHTVAVTGKGNTAAAVTGNTKKIYRC